MSANVRRNLWIAITCGFAIIFGPSNCRSDEIADTKAEIKSVESNLASAKSKFRKNLSSIPEYQAAEQRLAECTAAVKATNGKGEEFNTAFKAKLAAQAQIKKLADDLEAKDPTIQELSERLPKLKAKLDEQLAAQKALEQKKAADVAAEKEKASNIGRFGDLEIRLVGFGVSKILLIDIMNDPTTSKDKLLYAKIRITNFSTTKKIDYSTWRGGMVSFNRGFATAKDNFGNSLKRIDFGIGTKVANSVKDSESIYPGKSVDDILVFEEPVDGTTKVTLELPRKNIGLDGDAIVAELPMK